ERGFDACHLEGGLAAWRATGGKAVPYAAPTRWVTRERPKIDRIACPWLIRRFIDPGAQFFYVPTDQVFAQARRLAAVPYHIPGAPGEHDGEKCSFDTLLAAVDLHDAALDVLARVVRGADTDRPDLAPQCH